MKGVWSSVTKGHITLFLVIFSLITVINYIPAQYYDGSTGLAVEDCSAYGGGLYDTIRSNSGTITTNTEVGACCAEETDCVTDHSGEATCVAYGTKIDYNEDEKIDSFCATTTGYGTWADCDSNSDSCTSTCSSSNQWINSGEGGVGQYVAENAIGCCGDDSNEYVLQYDTGYGAYGTLCCNSPTDKIVNGKCQGLRGDVITIEEGGSVDFNGKDVRVERVGSGSAQFEVEDKGKIILLDSTRLVSTILITLEDIGYEEGSLSNEVEVSLQESTIQEICNNDIDDDLDGVKDALDTDCSGAEVSISRIAVSDGKVTVGDEIDVTCTLDLNEVELDDVQNCVYVELGDEFCETTPSKQGDNRLVYECDVGIAETEKLVSCNVDVDCNTDESRKRETIQVEGETCVDEDGDGYCGVQDCNENSASSNYFLPESCGDNIDNNCNGLRDENCCNDGTRNGGEIGIDCGGSYCASCGGTTVTTAVDDDNDWDDDGLTNQQEFDLGTNPYDPDSDGDGILDGEDPEPLVPKNGFPTITILFIALFIVVALVGVFAIIKFTNNKKEKNINNPRLVSYITKSKARGVPEKKIVEALTKKGWDAASIEKGLKQTKKGK